MFLVCVNFSDTDKPGRTLQELNFKTQHRMNFSRIHVIISSDDKLVVILHI